MCFIVLLYNDCIVHFVNSVTIFMWGADGYVTTYCADLYLWEVPAWNILHHVGHNEL